MACSGLITFLHKHLKGKVPMRSSQIKDFLCNGKNTNLLVQNDKELRPEFIT